MLTDNKYRNRDVYQLARPECRYKYIGQTVREFITRFSEHRYTLYQVEVPPQNLHNRKYHGNKTRKKGAPPKHYRIIVYLQRNE